jgi:hypothetical protein
MIRQDLKGSDSTGISSENGCLKKARGAQFATKPTQSMCCEGVASPGLKEDKGSAHQPLHILMFSFYLLIIL